MDTRWTLSVMGLTGTAAALAAAGGVTWYYASRVIEPPHAQPFRAGEPRSDADDAVTVLDVSGPEAHLTGPAAARPGWWGVAWDGGYARVGPVQGGGHDVVSRPVEFLHGDPVSDQPTPALLDKWAAPADPAALGLPVDDVVLDGPVGPLPCWWFHTQGDERGRTWAVLVHGRRGSRVETLRHTGSVRAAGLPALVVSYRNDPDAPPSPDGRSHLGATEWQDIEAAVQWAIDHGARDVVLVGQSMGGACAAELLRHSPLREHVRALVLEAPVLRWGPVLRRAAVTRGLPPAVIPLLMPPTMALAAARARIDWGSLGSFDDLGDRPLLLIHGDADATVPVELADALAASAPAQVTYLRVAGAGHLLAWNVARRQVESATASFLARCGAV